MSINGVSRKTAAELIARVLDAQDGTENGQISAEVWNVFVADKGGKTIRNSISLDRAIASISTYVQRNAAADGVSESDVSNQWFNDMGLEISFHGQSPEEEQEISEEQEIEEEQEYDANEEHEGAVAFDASRQNTTLGAGGTLLVKGLAKQNQIKDMPTVIPQQVSKAKAKQVRNEAAKRIRDARKAEQNLKTEQKNLEKLKKEQEAARKKLAAERKRSYKLDEKGNKITSKEQLAAGKKAKEARVKKAQDELNDINKQLKKQKDVVKKAAQKKATTKNAANAARKKVTPEINKAVGKKAGKTVGKKAGKVVGKTAGKTAGKVAGKTAAKAGGKTLLKKIPVLGLIAGLGFAVDRAIHGDYAGAALEVASGAASCFPGIGTAASVAIDVGLGAKDLHDNGVI